MWDGKERRNGMRDSDEILAKLGGIEIQIATMSIQSQNYHKSLKDFEVEVKEWKDEIKEKLYGNGQPGLIKDVDRIKHTQKGWSDNLKVVWVSIVGLFFKVVYDMFKH